eukprot:1426886-Amphidinium_carterae.1
MCEVVERAVADRDAACSELHKVQEKIRALPEEPVPEPAKPVTQARPAPEELKLLLAYVQSQALEGCCEANLICGLLQQSATDGGSQARPEPDVPTNDA